jgi:adenine-specific DNA methylase
VANQSRRKLIEVALQLEAINEAITRRARASPSGTDPSALHLWRARRPLAAARAVIFAQMVHDPQPYVDGAQVPSGVPDQVVGSVTENGRTLKFASQGFERE